MSTSLGSFGRSATYSSKGAKKFVPGALSAGWPKFRRAAISTRMRASSAFASRVLTRSGWSGIGFAARGKQWIRFAHLLPGGIQERLDHAIFKKNPLRVLPSLDPGLLPDWANKLNTKGISQRFAGQFAERSMKICDREFFITKIRPASRR